MAADEAKIEIGRVVERGFAALGRRSGPFFALACGLSGLPTALVTWLTLSRTGGFTPYVSGYWALFAVSTLSGLVLQAAITRAALLRFEGLPPRIGRSLLEAFGFLVPMIGLLIVTTLLSAVGFLLLIVPGVIVFIMLIVNVPALIGEQCGFLQSLKRSRRLTKGSRGRIFLLLVLFLIVYLVIAGVASAIGGVIPGGGPIGKALMQGLSAAITSTLSSVMLASLYFELRTAKEGATVGGLAEVFA